MILALNITSCLSIALALYLVYILIDELQGNFILSEISFPSVLISIVVFANAVLAARLLIGNTKPRKEFLILQIFTIVPIALFIYQILFNSKISD